MYTDRKGTYMMPMTLRLHKITYTVYTVILAY